MTTDKEFELPTDYTKLDWRKGEKKIVREQYIELQEGKCYWCNQDLKKDPSEEVQNAEINWDLFPNGFQNAPHICNIVIKQI